METYSPEVRNQETGELVAILQLRVSDCLQHLSIPVYDGTMSEHGLLRCYPDRHLLKLDHIHLERRLIQWNNRCSTWVWTVPPEKIEQLCSRGPVVPVGTLIPVLGMIGDSQI